MTNSTSEEIDSTADTAMPTNRPRMKRNVVWSGISRRPNSGRMASGRGRLPPPTHSAMIMCTTETAVNMEMTMPSPIVTAKPRTGPDPRANSMVVAISVVTLESTIVL